VTDPFSTSRPAAEPGEPEPGESQADLEPYPVAGPAGDDTASGLDETEPDAESAGRWPPGAASEGDSVPSTDPLDELARERDEYRDALVRLKADFENYRKRVGKQEREHVERAAEKLVEQLLPVLDTADLALSHGAGEDVKQLAASLFAVLEREGLERIDLSGERFDPTVHDAVAHEPADEGDEQEVVEVLRSGYRWKGRVLRPAMVKVRG
jgi:molecular chaperone GrpE